MRAFITGVTGQDGFYLSRNLLENGYEVIGLIQEPINDVPEGVSPVLGDIRDENVKNVIKNQSPDEIYHLAAFVVGAGSDHYKTISTNILGTLNVLEAGLSCGAKLFNAASCEMFNGAVGNSSIYGISKLASVEIANHYRNLGLYVCNGVLFNHESPRRSMDFVTKKICKYVADLKFVIEHDDPGMFDRLNLGRLDKKRDWSHAADVVEAMRLTLQQNKCDDYLIGSGVQRTPRDILDCAFNHIGIHNWNAYVKADESFRSSDVDSVSCDTYKIESIGWKPRYSFESMIHEIIDHEYKLIA